MTGKIDDTRIAFEPRVALASLSGESDATWARAGAQYAGATFLGGIAIDTPTRDAARLLIERDRSEFMPDDPIAFIDAQLSELTNTEIQPGVNIRTTTLGPLEAAASICDDHGAILEINAHCRQDEICAVGSGETLLTDVSTLQKQVATAADIAPAVSVKVRAELPEVDLPAIATTIAEAGGDIIHIDAMDSEPVVEDVVAATDLFVIANNGVRDRKTVHEYLTYGADAVSVGRPSDDPVILERVAAATTEWFGNETELRKPGNPGTAPRRTKNSASSKHNRS